MVPVPDPPAAAAQAAPATPAGLPRRTRKPPKHAVTDTAGVDPAPLAARRHDGERVKTMMSAVQDGTRRARSQTGQAPPGPEPIEERVAAAPAPARRTGGPDLAPPADTEEGTG
jgi:hypothetical protein